MRTMYDGIDSDAEVIPTDAQLVAGYVDGNYVWSAADWARFPHSVHVGIAAHASTDAGIVLDVENGDATPAEAVTWTLMRRRAGADPTVYCNTSTWGAVRSAFQGRSVTEPHYWIANYNGDTAIPAGAIAHQHTTTARWDLSSVADYWPGVDPAPVSKTAQLEEEDDMSTQAVAGYATLTWSTGARHVVQAAFDRIGGNQPDLRVVLLLPTGEVVLSESWKPSPADRTIEFPAALVKAAYGVEFQPVGAPARYAVVAV